ncbi:MAG: SLC13 family permease, partial [Candidatus Margulisiibacteriota bacterium]
MDVKLASLLVFLGAYLLFIFLPNRRALVAAGGAGLLILFRVMTPGEAFSAVNWNVMGIFVGTLAVADVFMVSRVPAFLAEEIVNRAK